LPGDVTIGIQLLLLVVFAIKAAVFPLSFWLPDSYPTAPAPVTAVFAGLLTKVGVYAILRTQTAIFPNNPLTDLLGWAALATMVIAILGAIAQSEIKRLLSFTLVSHIGYMMFGIALATPASLGGAIFYTAHHITVQAALFLVAGLIERVGGSTSMDRLGGLASTAPVLGALFFIPAMNLAGIPPLSGFVGKLGYRGIETVDLIGLGGGTDTVTVTDDQTNNRWTLGPGTPSIGGVASRVAIDNRTPINVASFGILNLQNDTGTDRFVVAPRDLPGGVVYNVLGLPTATGVSGDVLGIVGTGADDASDAIDRRVEFEVVACGQ